MPGVIGHAREPLNHGRDARQRPQVGRKPVRAGTLAERLVDPGQLRRRQFRLPSGSSGPAQCTAPSTTPRLIPAAHTLPAHSQSASDLSHDLPGRKQTRRLTAALVQRVEVSTRGYMGRLHAPIIIGRAANVTLFCETH